MSLPAPACAGLSPRPTLGEGEGEGKAAWRGHGAPDRLAGEAGPRDAAAASWDIGADRIAPAGAWTPAALADDAPAKVELFGSADDASAPALALAMAREAMAARMAPDDAPRAGRMAGTDGAPRAWLWVQDRDAARLCGRPYWPGLPPGFGDHVIHIVTRRPEDALFALEEALRCRDLAFVIGELTGDPRVLDFTASRRLAVAAERHGVPLYLLRRGGRADLSAARARWRVGPAPSAAHPWNGHAPGAPGFDADLFRARRHRPGRWRLVDDGSALLIAPPAGAAERDDAERHGGRPDAAMRDASDGRAR